MDMDNQYSGSPNWAKQANILPGFYDIAKF
jgi:hypothetical protein